MNEMEKYELIGDLESLNIYSYSYIKFILISYPDFINILTQKEIDNLNLYNMAKLYYPKDTIEYFLTSFSILDKLIRTDIFKSIFNTLKKEGWKKEGDKIEVLNILIDRCLYEIAIKLNILEMTKKEQIELYDKMNSFKIKKPK